MSIHEFGGLNFDLQITKDEAQRIVALDSRHVSVLLSINFLFGSRRASPTPLTHTLSSVQAAVGDFLVRDRASEPGTYRSGPNDITLYLQIRSE